MSHTRSNLSRAGAAGVSVVVLLLSACASHSTATMGPATASAPSVKSTPTHAPTTPSASVVAGWSMPEARSRWLAMTESYRRHLGTVVMLGRSHSNDLPSWSKTCDGIASDESQLTADVAGGQWPAKEIPIASDLIDRLRVETTSWGICTHAPTAAAASRIAADFLSPSGSVLLANASKVILGVKAMDGALGLRAQ